MREKDTNTIYLCASEIAVLIPMRERKSKIYSVCMSVSERQRMITIQGVSKRKR